MSPFWRRILIAGGPIVGIFILGLLAFTSYAILSNGDGQSDQQAARLTATPGPTRSLTAPATPQGTPSLTPPPPTPSPELEQPTPVVTIVHEEAPPPTEEQAPPTQEAPPPTAEPIPPTPEPPAPTATPPPPTPTSPPPTQELSPTSQSSNAAACQAWIDAGQPPNDTGGVLACISFLTEVCLAYQSNPSVAGGAEACQALDILLGRYTQPPSGTGDEIVVESCIEGDFEGWEGDTIFELCNGQVWIQASYDYLYHYAYRPDVTIVSTDQGYRMFVEAVSDSILVTRVTDFIRTCIDGDFEGWEGDTVFALCNGQVWQQASYDYTYHYAYRPDVLIYWTGGGYRMRVEGVGKTIAVIRLR
jgi:hypothetical protein